MASSPSAKKLAIAGLSYSPATSADIPAMARLRASEWGDPGYWHTRIRGYMAGDLSPGQALQQRIVIAARKRDGLVGFVAGHLTTRFGLDGELEWINVDPAFRRTGVATALVTHLAKWFMDQNASHICVDPGPSDSPARAFYHRLGATSLDEHWLVWNDISLLIHSR